MKFLFILFSLITGLDVAKANTSIYGRRCQTAAVATKLHQWVEAHLQPGIDTFRVDTQESYPQSDKDLEQGCCVKYRLGPDYCIEQFVCINTYNEQVYRNEYSSIPWCGY